MLSEKIKLDQLEESERGHSSTYSSRFFKEEVPKHEIPPKGMPANAAYQLIHDELNMDANPALNLASFVTTWMEPEANQLIIENIHKNFIDHDEYPQTEVIHERMVNMLARLFNSPEDCTSIGSATIGSSEAIMLAGLAHKWNWKKRRIAEGKSTDKPNIIFGTNTQICWDKFARYFDVELRLLPLEKGSYTISAERIRDAIDENTTCVGAILGTTFTGENDPIQEINDMLIEVKKEKGWDIPLHIDGASGGFVIPFTQPDFAWDFRLERVKSINASGHKYGLVYPGVGWVIFRDKSDFPEDLIFKVNYLGGEMPTFTLNFSRGGAMIIAQYYNFLRLGIEGYSEIMNNLLENSQYLASGLEKSGRFDMINKCDQLPIVAAKLKDDIEGYTVFDLSKKVRERGWVIPAYTMPPNAEDVAVIRIVVKENFSRDMADIVLKDIIEACEELEQNARAVPTKAEEGGRKHRVC